MGKRLITDAGEPILRPITLSDRSLRHPKWLCDLIYSPASTTGSFSSEVLAPSLKRISKDAKNPCHLKQAVCAKLVVGAVGTEDISSNSRSETAGDRAVLGDHSFTIADLWHPHDILSSPGVGPEVRPWLFGNF